MTTNRLTRRGPNATTPAKLPGLQALRLEDPQAQKAFEALREWVEVRLGSRGDRFERAVTMREFEKQVEPLIARIGQLGDFTGEIGTLRADKLTSAPALRQGAFAQVGDDLLYCNGRAWFKVTLAAL